MKRAQLQTAISVSFERQESWLPFVQPERRCEHSPLLYWLQASCACCVWQRSAILRCSVCCVLRGTGQPFWGVMYVAFCMAPFWSCSILCGRDQPFWGGGTGSVGERGGPGRCLGNLQPALPILPLHSAQRLYPLLPQWPQSVHVVFLVFVWIHSPLVQQCL